jgi:hypothetical protein
MSYYIMTFVILKEEIKMEEKVRTWMKSHKLADLDEYLADDYSFYRALEIIDLINDLSIISENELKNF